MVVYSFSMRLLYRHLRISGFDSVCDPIEESDSDSVLLVAFGRGVVSVGASSGCSSIDMVSFREEVLGSRVGAERSTVGERGASRRVSLAAGLADGSSTGGFGVSCIVVFVGGVLGIVAVDTALMLPN
jgi:hypothetical protein